MEIKEIDVNKIILNPNQPRKEFDKGKLNELSKSIKEIGLINPIQVKQNKENPNKYELICGERRLRAYKLLKKKKISAIIKNYNSKKEEMIESLVENLHRANLNFVERENFIYALWKLGKYNSKRELAKSLGLSREHLGQILSSKEIRDETLANKSISTRTIIDTKYLINKEDKKEIFNKVVKKEILPSQVRNISQILSKSPDDVKKSYFLKEITIEQAKDISSIDNEKIRKKLISTHKEIKNISQNINSQVKNKIKQEKTKVQVVKVKEYLNEFRGNSLELKKQFQVVIKSFIKFIKIIDLADEKQLNQFKYFKDNLESSINSSLNLINDLENETEN
jgi:ParB/RepB/Spo0J family partition protein